MSQWCFALVDSFLVPRSSKLASRRVRRRQLRMSSRSTHHCIPQAPRGNSATAEQVSTVAASSMSVFTKDRLSTYGRSALASIIILGGSALSFAERVQEITLPFADKLGPAIGASRAAVDLRYALNDWLPTRHPSSALPMTSPVRFRTLRASMENQQFSRSPTTPNQFETLSKLQKAL